MFSRGYILGPRADWIWFLGLPYVAVVIALACHWWLPVMALASVGLWITIPHHFATWFRTYGFREDWNRWKHPLVYGPVVVLATTAVGLRVAPTTMLVLTLLWDHQHSLMQQYGLGRIYDFKARSGEQWTGRSDFLLHCALYGNMLITAPLFFKLWGPELYSWKLPVTSTTLTWIQCGSWGLLAAFLTYYVVRLYRSMRAGHAVNPIKYFFIGSSYFLWYFTSWQVDSLLVFGIAHRLMHGAQYIAIVNSYVGRKLDHAAHDWSAESSSPTTTIVPLAIERWKPSSRTLFFILLGLMYAVGYQLLLLRPLDELGFGVVNFMGVGPQPRPGMSDLSRAGAYDMFAATLIQGLPITHYFVDSFIWKVSDSRVQQGL